MNQDTNKKKNVHENHRARMRETIRKTGVESIPDINLLEYLLFYSIPRKDTNEIAHNLLNTFGSLNGVLNASYEQLLGVDGMGESSALLISLIPGISRRYIESAEKKKVNLSEPSDAVEYIKSKFFGEKNEVFYILCLDALGNLINCCKLGDGNHQTVMLDKRGILETAFRNNADTVIFAHNHPNGVAAPSRKDIETTDEMQNLFRKCGIRLVDHIIVANGETLSLASTTKYSILFR
ncbi:MAG: DNA repair protein RadC [Clostridia bacterium]|nr:DNA repair protein RadC [Clostridia bacterium]